MKYLVKGALVLFLYIGFKIVAGLHEDQAGKFDWHQKYIGRVNFIEYDPSQPKRILVGAEGNVIAAVHGNTGEYLYKLTKYCVKGAVLYRQLLEKDGVLVYFGLLKDRKSAAVSYSRSDQYLKVRLFNVPTGVLVEEWAMRLRKPLLSAIVQDGENKPQLSLLIEGDGGTVTLKILSLETSNSKAEDSEIATSMLSVNTEQFSFGSTKSNSISEKIVCKFMKPSYFVCSKGSSVYVASTKGQHLKSTEIVQEEGPILDLKADYLSFVIYSLTNARIFVVSSANSTDQIQVKEYQKKYPKSVVVSSYDAEEDGLHLFMSKVENPELIKISKYAVMPESADSLSTAPETELELIVSSPNLPIDSLALCKLHKINSKWIFSGVTKDLILFSSKLEKDGDESRLAVGWSRQEALSSILAVEMVDFPSEVGPTWNPYASSHMNLLSTFFTRMKYEAEALILGESGLYSSSAERFGLRKVIVALTAIGKVIGMDSISGQILYTFLIPGFSTFKNKASHLYLQRTSKYTPLKPVATVVFRGAATGKTGLFPFDPVQGTALSDVKYFPPILQSQMLHNAHEDTSYVKPILLLSEDHKVYTFPPLKTNSHINHPVYFLVAKNNPPVLQGLEVKIKDEDSLRAEILWDMNLAANTNTEIATVHGKIQGERIHSQGRVLPDRSVSYKYMNPNLVVVVTTDHENNNINLFLVDAVSGSLIHSIWHKKCRGPVHVVHSEHFIVYSLFNEKTRRFEMNCVELYEGQIQSNSSAFSSFASPPVEPIIVKQSFIYPTAIQFMTDTRTEKGITSKDILISLPSGGIVALPRAIVQPRLSQQHYTTHHHTPGEEDGIPQAVPYMPELPVPADMIINYNQSVRRVDGIKTWPTRLESTCLVLVYGNDLFYTRVTPSKTFDILKDDFDHWFITVCLAALCLAAYFTKRLAARKQLEQSWR